MKECWSCGKDLPDEPDDGKNTQCSTCIDKDLEQERWEIEQEEEKNFNEMVERIIEESEREDV
jgi:hypothetical protein